VLVYGETAVNRVVALRPGGQREVITPEVGDYHNPRLSPDGRRLLLDRQVRGRSARDVWVLDLADRSLTRVTSKGDAHDAVWTADGRGVTYISLGTPGGPLFTAPADGSGNERPISLPHLVVHPGQWLADGSGYVVGLSASEEGQSDIVVLPAAGGDPEPLVRTPYTEYAPAISPDGQWLAYISNESGRPQIYLRPLRGSGRILVSEGTAGEPVWSRDGRRLYYIEEGATTRLMAARIGPGSPARVLAREVVVDPFRHEGIPNHSNWDVTPDGRLVFVEPVSGGRLLMVSDWAPPS
jgi:serine/threonine-protein kinase